MSLIKQPSVHEMPSRLKLLSAAAVLLLTASTFASAQQKNKSWMELPRKDAEKLLADSPWSQTQVDTDASEMFYSPTRQGSASAGRTNVVPFSDQQSVNNNRADRGAVNQAVNITYRICFLSARPIRQAFAKMILAAQHEVNDDLVTRLQSFVDRDFSSYVVIAVSVNSNDPRFSGPIMQAINSGTTGTLKNTTYLERQDGKRLFLIDYLPPIADGLGAKFIFPRMVDGEPFLKADSGTIRFVAEFSQSFKMNMRYKVADMMLDKKLEY
ncbi:MAG: hypothetical protein DMF73_05955 [Acidobacteria bacterium]|nr:MAG: hypothetical protein DMF73_05955 [Acidobacteriota bacterium]